VPGQRAIELSQPCKASGAGLNEKTKMVFLRVLHPLVSASGVVTPIEDALRYRREQGIRLCQGDVKVGSVPVKLFRITPTMVKGTPLEMSGRPITWGSLCRASRPVAFAERQAGRWDCRAHRLPQ
jgi:hypothetical protein